METRIHWDEVYSTRLSEDLGWYEPRPATLDLVRRHSSPADSVIDIGSGDSRLVDQLVADGYCDLTLLDLSATALERSRSRLTALPARVSWIHADVTTWSPTRTWDLWHDRAVFHFLVDEDQRRAYRETAHEAVAPDGRLIVATFSPDGPEKCAGLPVRRYEAEELAAVFEPEFTVVETTTLEPADSTVGDQRPYVAVVLQPVPHS